MQKVQGIKTILVSFKLSLFINNLLYLQLELGTGTDHRILQTAAPLLLIHQHLHTSGLLSEPALPLM